MGVVGNAKSMETFSLCEGDALVLRNETQKQCVMHKHFDDAQIEHCTVVSFLVLRPTETNGTSLQKQSSSGLYVECEHIVNAWLRTTMGCDVGMEVDWAWMHSLLRESLCGRDYMGRVRLRRQQMADERYRAMLSQQSAQLASARRASRITPLFGGGGGSESDVETMFEF